MDDASTEYLRENAGLGWFAGLAAIALTSVIVFLAVSGALSAQFVLWLDAALIGTAVVGVLAWIVASIAGY